MDDVLDILKTAKDLCDVVAKCDEIIVDDNMPRAIAEIVKFHAKGAAATGLASGWVPGVGGTAMAVTSAGFIWSMYARIGEKVGLKFSENVLKSIATGVATNLAGYAVASIAITTVSSFIPLAGNILAATVAGGVSYAITLVSGIVYMKLLTTLFKSNKNINEINESELKNMADDIIKNENIDEMMKKAKSGYKK
ncbi:hypothetical protein [Campylobacter mucosalis]|uniref:hypothetical protein n=1 Tax=Campylobacter mucosalis TaxID=202 RepID=UPI00146FEE9F|nr:hypothetical protein [Campylobacter mucosalis]